MPQVIFEGDTQAEIVTQVRRWLASLDADDEGRITAAQAVSQGAALTKDALRIVASAAPKPIAENDLVKALTDMGYKATDATKDAVVQGLDSVASLTGGTDGTCAPLGAAACVFTMAHCCQAIHCT